MTVGLLVDDGVDVEEVSLLLIIVLASAGNQVDELEVEGIKYFAFNGTVCVELGVVLGIRGVAVEVDLDVILEDVGVLLGAL